MGMGGNGLLEVGELVWGMLLGGRYWRQHAWGKERSMRGGSSELVYKIPLNERSRLQCCFGV